MPLNESAPPSKQTDREYAFDIVNVLCSRFVGLSPFEVLNTDFAEVMGLYVDSVIHDYKEKHGNTEQGDIWVTSANATWH